MIKCSILTKPDYKNCKVHGKLIFNGTIPQIPPKECLIEVQNLGGQGIYSMHYCVESNHLEIILDYVDEYNTYKEITIT